MKKTERISSIFLLLIISLSNLAVPLSYAAQDIPSSDLSPPRNALTSVPSTPASPPKFHQPDSGSVLGASTSLLTIGSQGGDTQTSASQRIPLRMQQLVQKVYQTDEDVTLAVTNPDDDPFTTSVLNAKGQSVTVPITQTQDGTTTNVAITGSNEITPGAYTIKVTDDTGTVTTQDFSWGVLALNPDKSLYRPGETADLSMAVLDDQGNMVCDATLTLKITNQAEGSTDILSTTSASGSAQIVVNPQCQQHDYSLQPDYQASYQFKKAGTYTLQLTATTQSGTHSITDTVPVTNDIPFDVQRVSATRVFPPNTYPMTINIKANRDFSGTVTETVPEDFVVTPATMSATPVASYSNMQTVYLNTNDPAAQLQQAINASGSGGLVMPFHGYYPITQGFGAQMTDPTLQAFYTQYGLAGHDGVDFGVPMDTPLYAVDDGNVIWSGPGDYGTTIIIQHSWGQSYYGHLSTTAVTVGTHVTKGQLIGYSGESGEATGPHLHFGMRPNTYDKTNGYYGKVDPLPYLPYNNQQPQDLATLDPILSQTVLAASTSATPDPTQEPSPSASGSAASSISPTAPASLPTEAPATPTQGISGSPTTAPSPTQGLQQTTITESPTPPANTNFTVLDKQILLSEELATSDQTDRVKVLTWNVSLKKGESTSLGYDYQTPRTSPQFFLVGPIQFYQSGSNKVVFQEQRQWQIANDDVGVEWYNNNTGSTWNGYSWQYRKKLSINASQVSTAAPQPSSYPTVDFMDSGGDATKDTNSELAFWTSNLDDVTVDSSTSETGPDSLRMDTDTSGAFVTKSNILGDSGRRISFYVNFARIPTANSAFMTIQNPSGPSEVFSLTLTTGGVLELTEGGGQFGSSGATLSAGTWYRIDVSYQITSTTVYGIRVYVNGTQSISNSNTATLGATGSNILVLTAGSGNNQIINYDDIYVDSGTDLSDPGNVHVTAKRPNANGAANNFTVSGTPTGSYLGNGTTNHWSFVSERPLDASALVQTSTANTSENYMIEGAASGDVNTSGDYYIADQAWIDAKTSVACTGDITNNGTNTAVSLTTSFAMDTQYTNNTAYPSGSQAIGIESCTSTQTVQLGEAGMQIAYRADAQYEPTVDFMDSGGDETGLASASAELMFTGGATTGSGATVGVSNTTSETGPDSWQFNTGSSNQYAHINANDIVQEAGNRISVYVRFANLPTGTINFLHTEDDGGNDRVLQVDITSGGVLQLYNGTGTTQLGSNGATLSTGIWYRLALSYNISSTTSYTANVYVNGVQSITASNSPALTNTQTQSVSIGWMDAGAGTNAVMNADDIYVDSGTDDSDPGNVHVTAKRPFANGFTNTFATQIGAGGSGYGSGHAPQVNERPLSTTNGWTGAHGTTDEYTIEGASQGDVNISSDDYIADDAWIYGSWTSGTASCTSPEILNNGTFTAASAITSTTATMVTNIVNNSSYLPGDIDVGMASCTDASGTHSVNLYEAGVQVAYIAPPSGSLTNFPVLINLTSDPDLIAHAQNGGNDILFTDSTGESLLNYQVVSYSAGTLQAWVDIPSLSSTNNTIIYMYYGNPSATSLANAPNVWSGYTAAWHMDDNAATTNIADSTGNYALTNAANTSSKTTSGEIGNGLTYNGTSDTSNNADINLSNTNQVTVSFWVNRTWTLASHTLFEDSTNYNSFNAFGFFPDDNSDCNNSYPMYTSMKNGSVNSDCFAQPSSGVWHLLDVIYNRNQVAAYQVQMYIDGVVQPSGKSSNTALSGNFANLPFYVAARDGNSQFTAANLDEFRLSPTALTPGWIMTEYNNQNAPGSFYTLGSVETDIYAPTLSQIMRHGQFFGTQGAESGQIQPFTW